VDAPSLINRYTLACPSPWPVIGVASIDQLKTNIAVVKEAKTDDGRGTSRVGKGHRMKSQNSSNAKPVASSSGRPLLSSAARRQEPPVAVDKPIGKSRRLTLDM